jgi:hypothetical protein
MLVVETIAKIRRAFFVQKKPIKEICRDLRISRKAVRLSARMRPSSIANARYSHFPKLGHGGIGWIACCEGTKKSRHASD